MSPSLNTERNTQDIYQVKLLTLVSIHLLKIDCENNCTLVLSLIEFLDYLQIDC